MTWELINEDGNTRKIDDEDEAKETKAELEQLGATIELREVESESEPADNNDGLDAEIIEMPVQTVGGASEGDDGKLPEPRPEIKGYRGCVAYCRKCDAFSKKEHRCDFCGTDLAGEPVYRGDQL